MHRRVPQRRTVGRTVARLTTLALLGGLALVAGSTTAGLELVVGPPGGGKPLLVLPLEPGERFTLGYHHSVDGTPVWEEHSLDREGRIYIEEERFVLLGAGMGHWPGRGRLVARGPYQVIEDIHAPTGDFRLRVGGPGVDHTITWRGEEFDLTRVAAGRVLEVAGRRVSLLGCLWRHLAGRADRTSVTDPASVGERMADGTRRRSG